MAKPSYLLRYTVERMFYKKYAEHYLKANQHKQNQKYWDDYVAELVRDGYVNASTARSWKYPKNANYF